MGWNVKRARRELAQARHRLAMGTGTSDRTLARIATLSTDQAPLTLAAFEEAMLRAGVSRKRLDEALVRVEARPLDPLRARVSTAVLAAWARVEALPLGVKLFVLLCLCQVPVVGFVAWVALLALLYRERARFGIEIHWRKPGPDDRDEGGPGGR